MENKDDKLGACKLCGNAGQLEYFRSKIITYKNIDGKVIRSEKTEVDKNWITCQHCNDTYKAGE